MDSTLNTITAGFALNFLIALLVVRFIYYPARRDRNYVFTFLAFNTIIFFVISLLGSSELSIGVGFGLFAIFSVLRYRTDPMPPREMTYLFAIIALPTMNAILLSGDTLLLLLLANAAILGVLYGLEQGWGFRYEEKRRLVYDRLKLLKPENEELLLLDLQARTGLAVERVEIGRVDLVKKRADLTLYYSEAAPWTTATFERDEMERVEV